MSKNSRLFLSYGLLAILIISVVVYLNYSYRIIHPEYMESPFATISPKLFKEPIAKYTVIKTVDLDREKIFSIMTDVYNYPKVLPKNILSVSILNQTENTIFTEEEFIEKGVKIKFHVKHTIIPPLEHRIEILDSDAKGTKVLQSFELIDNSTTRINTGIELRFKGILTPFVFIPENNALHAANTILDSFVDYAVSKSQFEKIVDDLYREILLRPADNDGLQYFASQLESGKMTVDDIRKELLESKEMKNLLLPTELKTLDELNPESKKIVDDLYREILLRPADNDGLQYFASQLESGKMTVDDIRKELLESKEMKNLLLPTELKTLDELNPESKKIVDDLYREILLRPADNDGLQYFASQLESGKMTVDDIRKALLESEEMKNLSE